MIVFALVLLCLSLLSSALGLLITGASWLFAVAALIAVVAGIVVMLHDRGGHS